MGLTNDIREGELSPDLIRDSEKSNDNDSIFTKLENISGQLENLREEFSGKLKHDAFKEKLIDSLHQELQAYKTHLIRKHVQSLITDVIKIIDDIRKLSAHYDTMKNEDLEPTKLLDLLKRIPDDLEDIFFYQGVKPFTCEGTDFDPSRQRTLKRIETDDPSMENKVAESIRPGYEWDDHVIRPEIVALYFYKNEPIEPELGIYDE